MVLFHIHPSTRVMTLWPVGINAGFEHTTNYQSFVTPSLTIWIENEYVSSKGQIVDDATVQRLRDAGLQHFIVTEPVRSSVPPSSARERGV